MKSILFSLMLAALCLSAGPLRAATNVVQIRDYYFTPTNITIAVGDTILWTNATTAAHSHDSTSTNLAMVWSGPSLNPGQKYSILFSNAGTFPYICKTHVIPLMPANRHSEQTGTVIVASANLPPSVNLTNPANDAKFRAPANLPLQATASDPGGSVTNVQFFTNEVFCGNAPNPPYNFTLSNVPAGNYSLTARAADNTGLLATSTVINVFVLTNAVLSNPTRATNGPFRFTIQGIASQTYAMELSTNLSNWSAFTTNLAPANSFNITDFTSTNILRRYYRARQDL